MAWGIVLENSSNPFEFNWGSFLVVKSCKIKFPGVEYTFESLWTANSEYFLPKLPGVLDNGHEESRFSLHSPYYTGESIPVSLNTVLIQYKPLTRQCHRKQDA